MVLRIGSAPLLVRELLQALTTVGDAHWTHRYPQARQVSVYSEGSANGGKVLGIGFDFGGWFLVSI